MVFQVNDDIAPCNVLQVISADEASSESESDDDEENEDDDEDEDDDEEASSDDENEDGKYKGNKSLYYELFNAVRDFKIDGRSAIDPFVRLPNRRYGTLHCLTVYCLTNEQRNIFIDKR